MIHRAAAWTKRELIEAALRHARIPHYVMVANVGSEELPKYEIRLYAAGHLIGRFDD